MCKVASASVQQHALNVSASCHDHSQNTAQTAIRSGPPKAQSGKPGDKQSQGDECDTQATQQKECSKAGEAKHEDTKNQPEVHPAAEQAADGLPLQTLHRD